MADLMYRKIADDLRQQIESGVIQPGQPLPTELELRDLHRASRNVVRDAVHWLARSGLVETRRGQGYVARSQARQYVTVLTASAAATGFSNLEGDKAFAEVERHGGFPLASVPRVGVHYATAEVAAQLQIPEKSAVVSRQQERSIGQQPLVDQQPWSLQTTAYPAQLSQLGASRLLVAEDIKEGTVAYLEQALNLVQSSVRDEIEVRRPDQEEAQFFGFPPDDDRALVVAVLRIGFHEAHGRRLPFRATQTVFPADRIKFAVDAAGARET